MWYEIQGLYSLGFGVYGLGYACVCACQSACFLVCRVVCLCMWYTYIYIFVLLYSFLAQCPSMEGPQIGVQLKMGRHVVFT